MELLLKDKKPTASNLELALLIVQRVVVKHHLARDRHPDTVTSVVDIILHIYYLLWYTPKLIVDCLVLHDSHS